MFEQSFVSLPEHRRNPWAFGASITVQCLGVALLLAIPLWFNDALPVDPWTRFQLAAPPVPKGPEPPKQAAAPPQQTKPQRFAATDAFTAPREVPSEIDKTPDAPKIVARVMAPGLDPSGGGEVLDSIFTGGKPVAVAKPAERKLVEPEPAPPPKSVRLTSTQQAANLIRRVTPTYPRAAVTARIEGLVRLEAVITPEGHISRLQAVRGHPFLVPAALRAVKQWRYQPYLLNGKPVEVVTTIDVHFRMNR